MKADPQARGGDMGKITQAGETRFVPATDFQRTTRIAVGKAWTTATPEQQKQLYEQFQTLLVRTYAASLSQLRDQDVKFKFAPVNVAAGAKDVVVQSHVISNGGDDAIDYRMTKMPTRLEGLRHQHDGRLADPGLSDAVCRSDFQRRGRWADQIFDCA